SCVVKPYQIMALLSYTLSLHDALPIFSRSITCLAVKPVSRLARKPKVMVGRQVFLNAHELEMSIKRHLIFPRTFENRSTFVDFVDRKSTRLNSSHVKISYAVFCLKKKI